MNKLQLGRFHAEFTWFVTLDLKNWRKRNQVLGVLLLAAGDLQVFLSKDSFSSPIALVCCQYCRKVRQRVL
jgi:hypothetical protein